MPVTNLNIIRGSNKNIRQPNIVRSPFHIEYFTINRRKHRFFLGWSQKFQGLGFTVYIQRVAYFLPDDRFSYKTAFSPPNYIKENVTQGPVWSPQAYQTRLSPIQRETGDSLLVFNGFLVVYKNNYKRNITFPEAVDRCNRNC